MVAEILCRHGSTEPGGTISFCAIDWKILLQLLFDRRACTLLASEPCKFLQIRGNSDVFPYPFHPA
jgi:hypothetical protein